LKGKTTTFIALFAISMMSMGTINLNVHGSSDNGQHGVYTLNGKCDKTFEIEYSLSRGIMRDIKLEPDLYFLTVLINDVAPFDAGDGTLSLRLPKTLIDSLLHEGVPTGHSGDDVPFTVFVDQVQGEATYIATTNTTRTLQISFEPGTEIIQLAGAFLPGSHATTLYYAFEGREFSISVNPYHVCDWKFLQNEKTLMIRSDRPESFRISIPNELLGGPYTVFADGSETAFTTEQYQTTHTEITTPTAEKIEIIGTTAIPEFSSLPLIIAAAAIVGSITATKYVASTMLRK
jgi:hypothetical protein